MKDYINYEVLNYFRSKLLSLFAVIGHTGLTDIKTADMTDKQYKSCPLGTYKIDTPCVAVEANAFIDSTGTITT